MSETVNGRSDVELRPADEKRGPNSNDIHWHLLLGLAGLHLLFLVSVYFVPVLVFGRNAAFFPWARTLHGSLNGTQFPLIAVFWAISQCQWHKRTILALTGIIILSFAHVAVGLPLTQSDPSVLSTIGLIWMNTLQVFLGDALVLAILIDLLRPIWGSLTREKPREPEQTSLYTLLRTTTLSAFAVFALQYFGGFPWEIESAARFCRNTFFQSAFFASCIWMVFATHRNWIGLIGLLAVIALWVTFAHPNLLRNGPQQFAIYLLCRAAWTCTTFVVVRYFGFRLRKYMPRARSFQQATQ